MDLYAEPMGWAWDLVKNHNPGTCMIRQFFKKEHLVSDTFIQEIRIKCS